LKIGVPKGHQPNGMMIRALKDLVFAFEVSLFFLPIYPRCHGASAIGG
jgi:hypothetical protein